MDRGEPFEKLKQRSIPAWLMDGCVSAYERESAGDRVRQA